MPLEKHASNWSTTYLHVFERYILNSLPCILCVLNNDHRRSRKNVWLFCSTVREIWPLSGSWSYLVILFILFLFIENVFPFFSCWNIAICFSQLVISLRSYLDIKIICLFDVNRCSAVSHWNGFAIYRNYSGAFSNTYLSGMMLAAAISGSRINIGAYRKLGDISFLFCIRFSQNENIHLVMRAQQFYLNGFFFVLSSQNVAHPKLISCMKWQLKDLPIFVRFMWYESHQLQYFNFVWRSSITEMDSRATVQEKKRTE